MIRIFHFLKHCLNCAKAFRKLWRQGGYSKVTVAQINRGATLRGRRVLITGGSSGIGLSIARKCLSEGAKVVITGRNQAKLDNSLMELDSENIFQVVWDITDLSITRKKWGEVILLLGGEPDVLVNNAGILGGHKKLSDLTEDLWDQLISVNSKGLVFLTQCAVNHWKAKQMSAKIINISSMRGILGVQDGPYGMSKWALNGLTHGLGLELAPHRIIVNGIAPGIIATESINIKSEEPDENAYLGCVPVQRIGTVEEIAELAVFLMSNAANYIVGQTIVCDGGYTLKV